MLTRRLFATITLWLFMASVASGGVSTSVLVDARGVYLRTSNDDPAALPTIVDLAANGVSPGSQIEISFEIPDPGYNYGCSSLSAPQHRRLYIRHRKGLVKGVRRGETAVII